MGFTQYFPHKAKLNPAKFKKASLDCKKIVEALVAKGLCEVQYEYDDNRPPVFADNLVRFNGAGEDQGGETFLVSSEHGEHCGRVRPDGTCFNFCKTYRNPYDLAVCACLIVFQHHLGKRAFPVGSDALDNEAHWPAARKQCQEVLGYGGDFTLGE